MTSDRMRPEVMKKLTIITSKKEVKKVIEKLYELNVCHVEKKQFTKDTPLGEPLVQAEEIADLLLKIQSLKTYLNTKDKEEFSYKTLLEKKDELRKLANAVKETHEKANEHKQKVTEIAAEEEAIKEAQKVLQILSHIPIPLGQLEDTNAIKVHVGTIKKDKKLHEQLKKLDGYAEVLLKPSQNKSREAVVAFVAQKKNAEVEELLKTYDFQQLPLETLEKAQVNKKSTAKECLITAKHTLSQFKEEKETLEEQKEQLKEQEETNLLLAQKLLSMELEKAEAPLNFSTTKKAMIITGYIPKSKEQEVTKALQETKSNLFFEITKPGKGDKPPIKFKNKPISSPFEFLLHMYMLPKYGEIDPTFITFLTFPIFFGFMLGDVGYGMVIFLFFWFLGKKIPKAKPACRILMYSALVTIVFGVAFGEVFGFETYGPTLGPIMCDELEFHCHAIPLSQLHGHGGHGDEEAVHETSEAKETTDKTHGGTGESSNQHPEESIVHTKEQGTELYATQGDTVIIGEDHVIIHPQDNEFVEIKRKKEFFSADDFTAATTTTPTTKVTDKVTEDENTLLAIAEHEEPSKEETPRHAIPQETKEESQAHDTAHGATKADDHHGEELVYDIPRLLNRMHQKYYLLVIAIIIGFLHINLGLFLGFINELHHGLWKAICAKLSWYILQAGVAVLALAYTNTLPIPPAVGFVIIGISIVMIYIGEGAKGVVELPAIFSNMLSYLRLMAIGLASVGLALVVNQLAAPFFEQGTVLGIILAALVFIVGHTINILLGIIGPFLHSLRLHYVEFYGKFYEGGGEAFSPFGYKKE